MTNKTFKILSIDGGGIKGLYSARIIQIFEKTYDCHISDHFDLICGTSTGGILALALSLRIEASEICKLYETKGQTIFPHQSKIVSFFKQYIRGGKFSSTSLKNALEETFGDKCIGDSKSLLCIPSYSITDNKPCIFKYDHMANGSIHNRDNHLKYVDVALATSAAPTYFPIVHIKENIGKYLIDGGMFCNNPSLVGLIEAIRFFVGTEKEYKNAKILSISSIRKENKEAYKINKDRSFLNWKGKLIDVLLDGQDEFQAFLLKTIHESSDFPFEYHRIPSPIISAIQEKYVQMDKASAEIISFLNSNGNDVGNSFKNKIEIKDFFKERKTFII